MHVVLIEFRVSTPYPVQLANALGRSCRVTLMLPERAQKFAGHVDRERVNLVPFRMPPLRQPANVGLVWRLRRQLKTLQADLVHITFWHLWGSPGLGVFSRLPLVTTVHDVQRHVGERGFWAIPSALYRWQWRWADQIIVHATTARQQLVGEYGCDPRRVHTIPIGAYDYYRKAAQAVQAEQANSVLFFGRIWGYKGLQYLIEAEPLITEAVPDARIVIAGFGEDMYKYEEAMVHPDRFEVRNYYIPDEMVGELFQSASVVVLPYIEASQSGVIPIAYAFGKPVVATSVGGITDVVDHGETGYLVPPRDPRRLAEAVISVLKDDARRQEMGRKARAKSERELSWPDIARKTLRVYEAALGHSHR